VIDVLYVSPWPAILLWAALFVSDMNLTMICARMYRNGVREHLVFEGSYELTPLYQRDVDAQRRFSPRFLLVLAMMCVLLGLLWTVTVGAGLALVAYEVVIGMVILLQLTIHVRHLRNYFLFRSILAGGAVNGRLEYARPVILANSATELFCFAILYTIVALMTANAFVAGGALACALVGVKHAQWSRDAAARPGVAPGDAPGAPATASAQR
jgi:hypothetical protein